MLNNDETPVSTDVSNQGFDQRVRSNQQQLGWNRKESYDFIVCGSGSSGSVVARRLAENSKVSVLLLEAGGIDTDVAVTDAANWPANLGSDRDWRFHTRPDQNLNGRSLLWSMGKVLGRGSSINAMIWSPGHESDWEHFADETGTRPGATKKFSRFSAALRTGTGNQTLHAAELVASFSCSRRPTLTRSQSHCSKAPLARPSHFRGPQTEL